MATITPDERRQQREDARAKNRTSFLTARVVTATNGRKKVHAAINAALAVSARITDTARHQLAQAIADAATAADVPANRKDRS